VSVVAAGTGGIELAGVETDWGGESVGLVEVAEALQLLAHDDPVDYFPQRNAFVPEGDEGEAIAEVLSVLLQVIGQPLLAGFTELNKEHIALKDNLELVDSDEVELPVEVYDRHLVLQLSQPQNRRQLPVYLTAGRGLELESCLLEELLLELLKLEASDSELPELVRKHDSAVQGLQARLGIDVAVRAQVKRDLLMNQGVLNDVVERSGDQDGVLGSLGLSLPAVTSALSAGSFLANRAVVVA